MRSAPWMSLQPIIHTFATRLCLQGVISELAAWRWHWVSANFWMLFCISCSAQVHRWSLNAPEPTREQELHPFVSVHGPFLNNCVLRMQIYCVKSLTDIFNAYFWITSSWSILTVRHIFISMWLFTTDWIFFFFYFFIFFSHTLHNFIIKCITKSEKSTWSRGFTQETSVCVLLTQGGMVCGRLLIRGTEVIVGNTCALRKGGKWWLAHQGVWSWAREERHLWVRPITTENYQVALVPNQCPVDMPSVKASWVSSHGVSALICDVFFLNLLGGCIVCYERFTLLIVFSRMWMESTARTFSTWGAPGSLQTFTCTMNVKHCSNPYTT